MHKLKLSELNLSDAEVLTREQLKKVLGGDGGSGKNGYCYYQCKRPDGSEYGGTSNVQCTSNSDCSATCTSPDKDASYCDTAN